MPPKSGETTAPVIPRTHRVKPRSIQTSGIFRLPAELIVEILAYFGDPHRNILSAKKARGVRAVLDPDRVERLTVIRVLTMTCWHLRNMLFPLLWKFVEGCNISYRRPVYQRIAWDPMSSAGNGLYTQCGYLILNPSIAAYVQALSVDLNFMDSPKDLMTKFIDCLVRLPNLRTLEIFSTTHLGPITRGLKRKCARFPGIRELGISNSTVKFVGSCPNVESIIVTDGLSWDGAPILSSYGKGLGKLRRVVGINECYVRQVVQGCPDLQDICIKCTIGISDMKDMRVTEGEAVGYLRSLKCLAVVEFDFITLLFPDEIDTAKGDLRRVQTETYLKLWKAHLVQVLKDSPSKERKFLRWKISERQMPYGVSEYTVIVVENGELEVLPETSL